MDEKKSSRQHDQMNEDPKQRQLDQYRISNKDEPMTTMQGKKRSQDTDQLKAGIRGPSIRIYLLMIKGKQRL